jgi:4-cresol dehydrogenase (hydroxylating)
MQSTDAASALAACAQAIGSDHVLTGEAALAPYAANVSGLQRRLAGVVRPGTTEEVQRIVEFANRFRLPLYPISRGRNWGLGSRLPVQDGACIVDLARMNRIREVSALHHYAVVEPGVTQEQLHAYLRERRLPLIINVIGSGLQTSMLGNALERGIGYFASRAGSLSGLEVVLGNGQLLKTGFGHYEAARTTHIYKHGVGPGLDGLFYQSNYGIVTAAGIELLPWTDHHCSVIARIDDAAKLPALVDALAGLRRRELVRMVVHIGNRQRTICTLAPIVYEQLGEGRSREAAEAILQREGFGPWSAVAGVSGTREHVKSVVREIRAALRGIASVAVLDDAKLAFADRLVSALRFLPGMRRKRMVLQAVKPVYGLSRGVPTDQALKSVYWGAGLIPPATGLDEPDQGAAGLQYCLPMLPLDGRVAADAMRLMEETMARHGLLPMATVNILDERCIEIVLSVPFRRDQPERVAAATACVDHLQREFLARGYPPYRVGIQYMSTVVRENDVFWQTARAIKQVLDPNGIIAPGRYSLP